MFFKVWWKRSSAHWLSGWYAEDLYCLIPNSSITCWNRPDMKFEPWSDWIYLGRPTSVKNLINALTVVFALIFLRGIASGNLVDAHMAVNKYWLPDLVLGRGPTQSMITLPNGPSNVGIGCKGASGKVWFGLPTTWNVWQGLQNSN